MDAADLDYPLPPELVAQTPAEPRDSARLLVLERATGEVRERTFRDLPSELRDDDLVVLNDTRVIPARLRLRRATGGAVEVLLLERLPDGRWEALARPARRLRAGEALATPAGAPALVVGEPLGDGRLLVAPADGMPLDALAGAMGEMPLPPYIHEPLAEPDRYQTVYARDPGSAAAPTAGLHFTPELWEHVRASHDTAAVTLDVGLDTFRPLTAATVEAHPIHSEAYRVPEATAAAVSAALASGRRVVAVGTTTVRVLETVWSGGRERPEPQAPLAGRTRLLIAPPYRFRATGALVTNFHLPRSTLLALVMAFAGREAVLDLYRTAVERRFRFYTFGDATLIL